LQIVGRILEYIYDARTPNSKFINSQCSCTANGSSHA